MNTSYVKFNDENYIVSNEQGKQYIISANTDELTVKELLLKENKIEETEAKLKDLSKDKERINYQKKQAKIMHYLSLSVFACTSAIFYNIIPEIGANALLLGGIIGAYSESMNIVGNGTILSRKIKNKKVSFVENAKKEELDTLNKELAMLKNRVNYDRSNRIITSEIEPMHTNNDVELVSHKVRKLTK